MRWTLAFPYGQAGMRNSAPTAIGPRSSADGQADAALAGRVHEDPRAVCSLCIVHAARKALRTWHAWDVSLCNPWPFRDRQAV